MKVSSSPADSPLFRSPYPAPSLRLSLSVSLFFALLFILITFPLVVDFSTSFISPKENGDPAVFVWNAFVVRDALINHTSLLHTDWQLYPIGGSMLMHSHTGIIGLLNLLLNNPVLACNLALLLSFILSGLGGFRLSYLVFGNVWGAVLTGFVFSFSPYKLVHLTEHYNLMLTASIPFYILFFNSAFSFQKGRFLPKIASYKAFGFCLFLGLISLLSDYYTTFFLLYFSVFAVLYAYFVRDRALVNSRKKVGVLAGVLLLFHVLLQLAKLYLDDKGAFWLGGNVLSFFIPHANSFWWSGTSLTQFKNQFLAHQGSIEYDMYLGWALSIAVLIGIFKFPKSMRSFWGFCVLLYLLLCLPAIRFHSFFMLNSPTAVLHFIPFFNHVHVPPRNVMMLGLFIPLLLQQSFHHQKSNAYVYVFLICISLIEFWPKTYTRMGIQDVPQRVYTIQASSMDYYLPSHTGLRDGIKGWGAFNSNELYYQTLHRKKIVGGYFSRIPESTFAYYKDSLGIDSMGNCRDKHKTHKRIKDYRNNPSKLRRQLF